MKLRCPRCQSKIVVPEEWAGRTIRCKQCNKAFRIPRPAATIAPVKVDTGLNLEDLANIERGQAALDDRDRKELEHDQQEAEAAAHAGEPTMRVCPHCQKEVVLKDPYVEALCSNCWQPIPALVRGHVGGGGVKFRRREEVDFYTGLASAFSYPFGASGSLITSVAAAVGVILLPVAMTIGIAFAVEQGKAGTGNEQPLYLSGVEKAFAGFVLLEVLFFLAVGVHAFLDVVRATAIGTDKPPDLVWSPAQWQSSIIAYVALLLYYGVFAAAGWFISGKGEFTFSASLERFEVHAPPIVLILAALFTFFVPMHLIGIATSTIIRGLNPVYVGKSIAATHVHYLFLFVLVALYATIYGLAASAVARWFAGVLHRTSIAAGAGNVVEAAAGLLSWGVVIGFGFYGIYLLGRLHGLFARQFRKQLAFFD